MRPVRIITVFVFAAAVAVTGCTAHSAADHRAAAPAAAAPTAPPASPAINTPATDSDATTSQPVVLVDGRHPVIIKTVDPDRRRITFDLIQFYQGDDATRDHHLQHPHGGVHRQRH
jgi:hypothetical protein